MATRVYIAALLGVLSPSLWGAEVLRVGRDMTNIAISHDELRQWAAQDRVCVLQRAREIACGLVLKATPKGAIVRLDAPNYDVMAGDKVISKYMGAPPSSGPRNEPFSSAAAPVAAPPSLPAAASRSTPAAPPINSMGAARASEVHSFNVSAGVRFGTSFFYPSLSAEYAILPEWSVGLSGMMLTASGDTGRLFAAGALLTANYYSQEYFRGLWVQAGVGGMLLSVTVDPPDPLLTEESAVSFMGQVTAGWRGYWEFGLNIGVGAGFQFIATPEFNSFNVNATGLQPVVTLEVGWSF